MASDIATHQGTTRRDESAYPVPILDARPNSIASAIAARARTSPVAVFCLTALLGYLIVLAAAIGVGFLLVDALLPIHLIGHSDESVNTWLAGNRTGSLNDISYVASSLGDIPAIPALVILTALGATIARRWRIAAFILGAILVEVATYRVTSLIVHRHRPTVPRLDQLPVNQSYPSGHVAASVAVYVGLALLVSSRLRARWAVILVWSLAVAFPLAVALSRMYRGMHHPIDVAAGTLIGLASVAVALTATRAAEAAHPRSRRDEKAAATTEGART